MAYRTRLNPISAAALSTIGVLPPKTMFNSCGAERRFGACFRLARFNSCRTQRATLALASSLAGSRSARLHDLYLLSSGVPFRR